MSLECYHVCLELFVLFIDKCKIQHPPCYVGPCYNGVGRPRVGDGGNCLQMWRVASNLLNKQSHTAEKG
jgi:hypothetical protein